MAGVDMSQTAADAFLKEAKWMPRPLRRYESPDDYPVDCLPQIIRDGIMEVAAYVKAPMALVAGCALSAVSGSVQSRFNVQRDAALKGSAALYVMTVAESGERKSTIDKLFMVPVREWEARQAKAAEPILAEYKANLEAWEIEGRKIRGMMKDGDGGGGPFNPLVAHELCKPKQPRIPRMLRGDDTPEALAIALDAYPVAAVISAEAGIIFGSHGMSADSVQRNLAQANVMWDGGPIEQDRVTRERIHIEEVRVTMGLQVQPAVLQNFIQKSGGLARGIGYFARFLFAQPESTQGTRYYAPPPADMPSLRAFHQRITTLLAMPAEFDDFDRMVPTYVGLQPDAHQCWYRFHDEVEEMMGGEGVYSDVKDVASKAAENAARLACCLHVFGKSTEAAIPRATMADACALMRWYLDEAVRFGRIHDVTEEIRNAELLEIWLVQRRKADPKCSTTVNMARQLGPNVLRGRAKLEAALELLRDHGRIRVQKGIGSKIEYISVAPQVIAEWS